VVLVLKPAGLLQENTLESQFATQTALALTGFRVVPIALGLEGFFTVSDSERHELIRNITEQQQAAATLWVEVTKRDTILLHVMAFSTGQAFARIVETPKSDDAPLVLSLAAQEILAQITIEARPSESRPAAPSVSSAPSAVQAPAKTPASTPTSAQIRPGPAVVERKAAEKTHRTPLAISLFVASEGGVVDYEGPSILLGGGACFEGLLKEAVVLRIAGSVLSGFQQEVEGGTLNQLGVQLGAAVGYLVRFRAVSLGPMVDLAALKRWTAVELETTGPHRISWWALRLSAVFSLRWHFHERLFAALEPRLGVWPIARRFYLDPEGDTIYRSPRLDWGATLGMGIRF
jgi:hypothetical protein